MLKEVRNFAVDVNDREFADLQDMGKNHKSPFLIQSAVSINFAAQENGTVTLCAKNPHIRAPFYRISPVRMEAAGWISIEYDIPAEDLRNINQIIPCLDAACIQSTLLYPVLRIFYTDGNSEDVSSAGVGLMRDRRLQAFPISLWDLETLDHSKIKSAKLIFSFKARPIDIDIFGLTVTTVSAPAITYVSDYDKRLRMLHESGAKNVQICRLHTQMENLWTGETFEHRAICENVFLDMQPGEGRHISVTQSRDSISLDFTATASGKWRNLEFRFQDIGNAQSMVALVNVKGRSSLNDTLSAALLVRQYDENFHWEDVRVPEPFKLSAQDTSEMREIDLSSLLNNTRQVRHIGLMIFLPPEAQTLEIEEIDVCIFDRQKT